MILYLLMDLALFILTQVSNIIGGLIPDFPSAVSNVLTTISTMIQGGISFLSYFFYVPVVVGLITLVISWHGFKVVKDAIMKVVGHFFAN